MSINPPPPEPRRYPMYGGPYGIVGLIILVILIVILVRLV